MITAGCDLGTVTAKAVLIENGNILSHKILSYKTLPKQAVSEVMNSALSDAKLTLEDVEYCVATGFGKKAVSYATGIAPEIVCLNRAVRFLMPEVRTVVDVGGQSIRAFNINDKGRILDSAANEKCAAGTGKFIDVMAKALELSLDQVSRLPFKSKNPVSVTSQCGVFAESEVITYVNDGRDVADIVAGISRSVAGKVASLMRRISVDEKVAMVGGMAKNEGVARYIEEDLNLTFADINMDPQLFGALGAALLAKEKAKSAK